MRVRRFVWVGVLAVLAGSAILYPRIRTMLAPAAADAQQTVPGGDSSHPATPAAGHASPAIAVVTAVARKETVPITRTYVGSVEPIASVAVKPRIDGVVVKEPVSEGQTVKAGDLLFQLDDQTIQASLAKDLAAISRDQATLDQANVDLTRLQTLLSHGDVTQQQVDQQQAAVKVAAGTVASDKAQLQTDQVQLGFTKITAPIAGRIGAISVSPGALIHASDQTALLTITQMAPVRVSFDASERDLAAFRKAFAATPPPAVTVIDADTAKPIATGMLTFIDSSVDASSGTVTLKGEFANADESLWPGAYVRVQAELGAYTGATVVPTAAVQLNDTSSFVFLVKPDATVTRRTVTVADTTGDIAVVSSGLQPGDHVVIEGQLRLIEGSHVKETASATVASSGPAAVSPAASASP